MPYNDREKKQAITRVRRIKGQLSALEQAIDEGTECGLILHQLAAVRGGVNGLMAVILESYLKEEFPDNDSRTDSQRKSIDETIAIVRSYLR